MKLPIKVGNKTFYIDSEEWEKERKLRKEHNSMKCLRKNIECEWAGTITIDGRKDLGEEDGFHTYPLCFNDSIERDYLRCKINKT